MSGLAGCTELGHSRCAQGSDKRGRSKLEGCWSHWLGNTGQLASGCLTLVEGWKQEYFLACCMERGPVPLWVSWKQNRIWGAELGNQVARVDVGLQIYIYTTSLTCSWTQAHALSYAFEKEIDTEYVLRNFDLTAYLMQCKLHGFKISSSYNDLRAIEKNQVRSIRWHEAGRALGWPLPASFQQDSGQGFGLWCLS